MLDTSQVEVQTQVGLWSDPVERTPVCSQTKITGSGRKFESIRVWTMVWRWSDQRSIWSEKSDHGRFKRTWVWSEATSSAIGSNHNLFERTWVWSEIFSSLIESDQGPFRAPLFFIFFYSQMLALRRGNQKAAFWSETHLKSNSSDQKKRSPLQRKFWSTGDHDVSYGRLSKLIRLVRNIHWTVH